MHWLAQLNRWLRIPLNILVILSIVGLTGTMAIQVVLRYLLRLPLMGVEEMSSLFGLWLYFAGMALVSSYNQHIRGGFISVLLHERARGVMDRLFTAICALISLYFLTLAVEYAQFVVEVNRRSTFLRLPTVLWVSSLNLGLLVTGVSLAIQAVLPPRKAEP